MTADKITFTMLTILVGITIGSVITLTYPSTTYAPTSALAKVCYVNASEYVYPVYFYQNATNSYYTNKSCEELTKHSYTGNKGPGGTQFVFWLTRK